MWGKKYLQTCKISCG